MEQQVASRRNETERSDSSGERKSSARTKCGPSAGTSEGSREDVQAYQQK